MLVNNKVMLPFEANTSGFMAHSIAAQATLTHLLGRFLETQVIRLTGIR